MSIYHLGSLMIAALIYIACEFSPHCNEKASDHAYQLAMAIVIGTVGLAGPALQALRKKLKDRSDGPK